MAITPQQSRSKRIDALDVVKGLLVVFMVVYHCMNRSDYHPYAFRLMSFLPPSFVLITGFLLPQLYLQTFPSTPWTLTWRLWLRGGKLLLLFTVLNLFIQLALAHGSPSGTQSFLESWHTIYVIGDYRLSAFDVLLPIAYILLLSPLLLLAGCRTRAALPLLAATLLLLCSALDSRGTLPGNLALMSFGLLGAGFGIAPLPRIQDFTRLLPFLLSLWVACRWITFHYAGVFVLQAVDVSVSLFLFYNLALRLSGDRIAFKALVLLGRHSLLSYITQIGFLFAVTLLVKHRISSPEGLAFLIVVIMTLTFMSAWLTEVVRLKSAAVEKAYRLIFA